MPCVVCLYLCDGEKIIIVKAAWCQRIDEADTINHGSRPGDMMIFFFSPNKSEKPNFDLSAEDFFDETINACYDGFVLGEFGKETRSN